MAGDPFADAGFESVTAPTDPTGVGRPIIRKGVEPGKPGLPEGYAVDTGGPPPKATKVTGLPDAYTTPDSYRPMTADEKTAYGLDPSKPFTINIKTNKPELIPTGKDATPPPQTPDPFQTDAILKQIQNVRELAKQPFALGPASPYLKHIPIIGNNASNMEGALSQITGDIRQLGIERLRELNGGQGVATIARNQAEQQALQNAFAPLNQTQTADQFIKGLDTGEQLYRRQSAKAAGLDPMDPEVQKRFGINPILLPDGTPQAPAPTAATPGSGPPPPVLQITKSTPLPAVEGTNGIQTSGTTKTVIDPAWEKAAPRLEQMLAADPKEISNAQIIGWMQNNGLEPSAAKDALDYRMSPHGADWRKRGGNYVVDPRRQETLSGLEKARALLATSAPGAFLAGAAETGSMGADKELAGLVGSVGGAGGYTKARQDYTDKTNLMAYEHPDATVMGNTLGGLSSLSTGVPKTFGRQLVHNVGQAGVYGALSSDDPSVGGRFENALGSMGTAAVATPALEVASIPFRAATRSASGTVQRLFGANPEMVADNAALGRLGSHLPPQDIPKLRENLATQDSLGASPSGATVVDRTGQDYLGRLVQKSPAARAEADTALSTAEAKLPGAIKDDFTQAIDKAAGNEDVATFLNRPARDITRDVHDMAGREYEAGIAPIKHEPVPISPELADALSHEQIKGAISDALNGHSLDDQTRATLRGLPAVLKQVGGMDPKLAAKVFSGLNLDVDSVRNIATALDRKASKLADGTEAQYELSRLSQTLRNEVKDIYPEFAATNDRYSSRMRAINALDDARKNFLGNASGTATDALAKSTSRPGFNEPGAPEYPEGTAPTPSQQQMAQAGAREATVAAAGDKATGSALTTARDMSSAGQQERTPMVFGDQAGDLQKRAAAKVANTETLARISSSGTADDAAGTFVAGAKAIANLGFHRGGAAIASALSGIHGINAADSARIVRLYTSPGEAANVVNQLEQSYGRRKARFIINRIASLATVAAARRSLPEEAVQGSDAQAIAADQVDRSSWGARPDGSAKGTGFLGVMKRPDGNVSSEISVGLPINGKEMDIATMVPGLTSGELNWLLTTPMDQIAKNLPDSIRHKAVLHAQARIAAGLSPFKQDGE